METKELKITIPEGQEIDWKESAKQKKIVFKKKEVFKKKDTKPRSWKEYLELSTGFDGCGIDWNMKGGIQTTGLHHRSKAIVPTEYGAPFIAMMQLMSLRQAWIGDWKPDWSCGYSSNYCVVGVGGGFEVCILSKCRYALSFPTIEMAKDFMDCFKDLLEIAKPLI